MPKPSPPLRSFLFSFLLTHLVLNYRFTFFLVLATSALSYAQPVNLVPNGSFEERIECIWNNSNVKDAPPWFNPMDPEFENQSTPDVFHECTIVNEAPCPYPENAILDPWAVGIPTNVVGCEHPFEGEGYAGAFFFIPNYQLPALDGFREYLAVRLIEPLQEGMVYDVSMQLSLAERTTHAIWNVQVLFSEDSLTQPTTSYMPYEPQLNGTPGDYIDNYNGWRKVEWGYTATGGEQFMYIGNFEPNSQTDTLKVITGSTYNHFFPGTYYYIDDVRVEYESLNVRNREKASLHLYPNPCEHHLTVESSESLFEIQVWNHTGQVQHVPIEHFGSNVRLDTSGLRPGLYVIQQSNKEFSTQQKFVKR